MLSQTAGTATTRGRILVASSNVMFTDIVGDLVAVCGFTPVYSSAHEQSWVSLTRTQACIVICDCTAPAEGIQRLIAEASARHTPLVLSDTRTQRSTHHDAVLPSQRVAWLTFPVSRDAFSAMIETLLASGIATSEHAAIATALTAKPVHEQSLRRAVWAYVDAERDRGAVLGELIVTLTGLADAANIAPTSVRQALMRGMIVWGTEEYFRHPSDAPHDPGVGATAAVVLPHDDRFARSVP
jgi:hypothetical protein